MFEDKNPSLWFVLFIVLLIIGFMGLFAFFVIRWVNQQDKTHQKQSPDNTFANEIFEGTMFQDTESKVNKRTSNAFMQDDTYRHQKFENEE